jgi:NAD kinase
MDPAIQIREVYIDSTAAKEHDGEALDVLTGVLGSLAIEQVATPEEADVMIIMGGDGTFLHSLRRNRFPNIPVTGINTGTLGFYMDTKPTEEAISAMVQHLVDGTFAVKSLPLLEVPVGQTEAVEYATNEVVVDHRGS